MVKFVNKLEAKYPFADNSRLTKLAWVLLSDTSGFASVGWMFTRLIATTSWGRKPVRRRCRLPASLATQGVRAAANVPGRASTRSSPRRE